MKLLYVLLTLCFLTGCANTGSPVLKKLSESDVNLKIHPGKTTRAEVRSMYGSPLKTSYTNSGLEIWVYSYEDTTGFNVANIASKTFTLGVAGTRHVGTKKELIILFNDDYTVRKFNMSEASIQKGTGLL